MTDAENLKRKLSAAESRWEACQLQAANAQRELDYAIAVYEQHKDELPPTDQESTQAKIDEQKDAIKDFLLKSYQVFQDAVKAHDSGMSRINAKL
jgi:hypothetical protein